MKIHCSKNIISYASHRRLLWLGAPHPPPSQNFHPWAKQKGCFCFFFWGTILGMAFCFLLLLLLVLNSESLKSYSTPTIWGTMNRMIKLSFLFWNGCLLLLLLLLLVYMQIIQKTNHFNPFCLFSFQRRPEKCAFSQDSMCTCIKQNEPQHQI